MTTEVIDRPHSRHRPHFLSSSSAAAAAATATADRREDQQRSASVELV